MKILNIGAGSVRPGEPFINLDNLREQLKEGTPERAALNLESNYVEFDISSGPLPFDEVSFDSIAVLHCLEHFDAQAGVKLLQNCLHLLMPGGVLMVSVPDASYFRAVDAEDRNENWLRLFGQDDPNNKIPTFRQAALFFDQHKVVFTEDALWCCLRQAGFLAVNIERAHHAPYHSMIDVEEESALSKMHAILNRTQFSLIMTAVK